MLIVSLSQTCALVGVRITRLCYFFASIKYHRFEKSLLYASWFLTSCLLPFRRTVCLHESRSWRIWRSPFRTLNLWASWWTAAGPWTRSGRLPTEQLYFAKIKTAFLTSYMSTVVPFVLDLIAIFESLFCSLGERSAEVHRGNLREDSEEHCGSDCCPRSRQVCSTGAGCRWSCGFRVQIRFITSLKYVSFALLYYVKFLLNNPWRSLQLLQYLCDLTEPGQPPHHVWVHLQRVWCSAVSGRLPVNLLAFYQRQCVHAMCTQCFISIFFFWHL